MPQDRDYNNSDDVVVHVDFTKSRGGKTLSTILTGEALEALDRHIDIHGGDYFTAIKSALSHLAMMDVDYWSNPKVNFVLMRAEGNKDGYKVRRPYYGPEIVQD